MNFLAHLHLATLANSSLLGNLMADFVRGNPYGSWPQAVADGISLHRRVDALTDALPEVRAARGWFRDETRRVAPITLDVIWDHFLSLHWSQLSPGRPLAQFLAEAQAEITPALADTPARFQHLNRYLWEERWMERYAEADYLQRVLSGMASRRPRLAALSDSWQDFITHYHALETQFWQFYPRLMARARNGSL
ncbi:ACP phosphodiesterase [Pantoea sp. 1.19]|uniref:ACP phosphodiesterase n=1 Tax=Pantoea sp. 1.19 TaxID=1925589 RepID=UPI0009490E6D|nr:ACP phosphodiesterase [Pantoea sp. 1.19]